MVGKPGGDDRLVYSGSPRFLTILPTNAATGVKEAAQWDSEIAAAVDAMKKGRRHRPGQRDQGAVAILRALQEAGIEIPFPRQNLTVRMADREGPYVKT